MILTMNQTETFARSKAASFWYAECFLRDAWGTVVQLLESIFFSFLSLASLVQHETVRDKSSDRDDGVYVGGLGVQWPATVLDAEGFETWVKKCYDTTKPGIQKLLRLNKNTGIQTRRVVGIPELECQTSTNAPTVEDIDATFRQHATRLSVAACSKAIKEWGGRIKDITHIVAVTCTNAGSPGFDLEVAVQLGLSLDVERTLLHGIGCAGGLAALRTGERMARASGSQPANVLVLACEITTIHAGPELQKAEAGPDASIGPILFSDGAAALVVSNAAARAQSDNAPIYKLLSCSSTRIPKTDALMSYYVTQLGFRLSLSREVPMAAARSLMPTFKRISRAFQRESDLGGGPWLASNPKPVDFDWALHPGGLSVVKGAEIALGLTEDNLRASYDIYRTRGNTSSVAVLAVLDRLRSMGPGRDNIAAVSFGPGLMVEMAAITRCR